MTVVAAHTCPGRRCSRCRFVLRARELYDRHHAALVAHAGGTLPFVRWDALTPREKAGWEYAAELWPVDAEEEA